MSEQNRMNKDLFEALMVELLPKLTVSGGKYSVSIVNNINGKRMTVSQELAKRLVLTNSLSVMPSASSNKLVLGKTLPFPQAYNVLLKGDGKKIAYNAELVEVVTKTLNLDFSNCTSRSFNDITFDELEGVPVAIVNIP